ncbi:MAG TPA: MarR family transcriptional regulator [Anaerolineae bacterium]|nr:MarR family transcriptional regulator [Anaerolineae bacterium]
MIHEVYVLSDACDRQILSQYDLNISQFRLLSLLHNQRGQRLTVLSQRLLLSKSTITRLVDQLEHKGWAQRVADPEDRRAQRVVLTPAGFEQRAIIADAHLQSLEKRLQALTDEEKVQLKILLDKLSAGLRSRLEADNPYQIAL